MYKSAFHSLQLQVDGNVKGFLGLLETVMKQDVSEITAFNIFKPAKYLLLITHFF